jgi:hypothetical protein
MEGESLPIGSNVCLGHRVPAVFHQFLKSSEESREVPNLKKAGDIEEAGGSALSGPSEPGQGP